MTTTKILLTISVMGFLFTLMYTAKQNHEKTNETITHYSDVTFHKMANDEYIEYSPNGHYIVKVSLPKFGSDTIYLRVSESAIESKTKLTNYGSKKKVQRIKTREEPD